MRVRLIIQTHDKNSCVVVHMLKGMEDLSDLVAIKPSLFGEIQTSNRWCVCVCVCYWLELGEDQLTPNIHVYMNMYTVTLN